MDFGDQTLLDYFVINIFFSEIWVVKVSTWFDQRILDRVWWMLNSFAGFLSMSHVPIVSKFFFFFLIFSQFLVVVPTFSWCFRGFPPFPKWTRHFSGPRPEGAARPGGGAAGGGGRPRGGRQEEPGAPGIFVDAGDLTMVFPPWLTYEYLENFMDDVWLFFMKVL